ncbi:hypothetical protein [Dictyobacter arantiisoli]|uniref:Uncharacterized protein n=1 Tax=Dictyobacter arantiisoli TaxID=2014874 RepID=A0A5A5THW8_9CHLR|nr:hypothetical protein [Dictyobacter arantiisoli]GCF10902.1 hypothetical protein KDI_44660 [Dictyobacter arantiisoli]
MSLFVKKVVCRDCGNEVRQHDAYLVDDGYQCKSCYLAEPLTEMAKIRETLRAFDEHEAKAKRGVAMKTKLEQLDAVTIDAFLAWTVEAINYQPMSREAKDVVDALIVHSQQLWQQEAKRKQEVKNFWTQEQPQ